MIISKMFPYDAMDIPFRKSRHKTLEMETFLGIYWKVYLGYESRN